MGGLEKRLAETERALFFALRELHDGAVTQGDYHIQSSSQAMRASVISNYTPTTQLEKAELAATWCDTPLGNRAQAKVWLDSMRPETETSAPGADNGNFQEAEEVPVNAAGPPIEVSGSSSHEPVPVRQSDEAGELEPVQPATQHLDQMQESDSGSSQRKGKRRLDGLGRASSPSRFSSGRGNVASRRLLSPASEPSKAHSFASANQSMYF